MWNAFKKEDLYLKKYSGLYCVGCEEFKMEKDLVDSLCPDHKVAPEVVEEENWFFKLSNYADRLLALIESGELKIYPDYRKNEVVSFIKMGLEDFSISRSVARAKGWGVPVPGDESQIMYVWVDALSNYITALDYATDGERYKNSGRVIPSACMSSAKASSVSMRSIGQRCSCRPDCRSRRRSMPTST